MMGTRLPQSGLHGTAEWVWDEQWRSGASSVAGREGERGHGTS